MSEPYYKPCRELDICNELIEKYFMTNEERAQCSRQEYLLSVRTATLQMQEDIYSVLKNEYRQMIY